jgi:hypothetical protein
MLTDFPSTITQGDSFTFTTSIDEYPPTDGYTLNLAIRGLSSADIVATTLASDYIIDIPTSISSTLTPGTYKAIFFATKGIERITLYSKSLEVLEDPILMGNIDMRSHEQIMLDAIEAFIEKRATQGQLDHLSTEIDAKKLQRMSMTDLVALRDHYKSKVMVQTNKAPRKFLYQFTR